MSTKTTTKTKKKTKAKKLHKLSIERPHGKVTCFVDKQSGVLGPKLEPQGKVGTTPVPEKPKEKIPLVQTWKKKASKRRYQATSVISQKPPSLNPTTALGFWSGHGTCWNNSSHVIERF